MSEIIDADSEILLEDAQKIKKSYKLGDEVLEKFVPKDFQESRHRRQNRLYFKNSTKRKEMPL